MAGNLYGGGLIGGGGAGGVTSFNSRVGAVVPAASDYDGSEVDYDNSGSGLVATDVNAAIDEVLAAIPVDSVFGRTGAVVATASDYDADQIDYDNTNSPDLSATDVNAVVDELVSLGAANGLGFRNLLINGGFDIWQRGTSFSDFSNPYTVDRWYSVANGHTAVASRQDHDVGQTDVPGGPAYFLRMAISANDGDSLSNCYFGQRIEALRALSGNTVTLSFYAKADASRELSVEFVQAFGSGGSATVTRIGISKHSIGTSWQQVEATVALPSISGATIGTGPYLQVYVWLSAGTSFASRTSSLGLQTGTFDLSSIQLETGSVATPFERRPLSVELALCQRYFQKSYPQIYAPGTVTRRCSVKRYSPSATAAIILPEVQFPATMRAEPTITLYSPDSGASGYAYNYSASAEAAASADFIDDGGFRFKLDTTVSSERIIEFHYVADAEL